MSIKRRSLLKLAAGSAALTGLPRISRAQSAPHVIVVGGGFSGASVAKYLRHWDPRLRVTLVEPAASHTSCVLSNLVLNGRIGMDRLNLTYGDLASRHGVEVIRDVALQIDGPGQRVHLLGQGWLPYDRLVVGAGISFDAPPGWNALSMPHAWIAGFQTLWLRWRLLLMPRNGHFIMTVPASPYRCPPGPYERACLVANLFKRRGGGRVTVLDANPGIQAESTTFSRAFSTLYSSNLEYIAGVQVQAVDAASNTLETNRGTFRGDLVNLIPTNQAAWLVRASGLAGNGRWAPVDPLTYESTLADFANVHVIGDSQGTNQPKSAHMGNAQAKICADGIIRLLDGRSPFTDERIANVTTNSACYSPVTFDQASWLTAVYAYDSTAKQMALTQLGEAENWSRGSFQDMFDWSANLFADSFG